jgi:hypothetical protein
MMEDPENHFLDLRKIRSASKNPELLPAVSQSPRFTVLPSTTTLALKLSKTVGT